MKPAWFITLLVSAGIPAAGLCSGDALPIYAIAPETAFLESGSNGAGSKQQSGTDAQWIAVGQNPTFRLQFVDVVEGSGAGFDHPVLGPSRRAVAIEAFSRIATILAGEPGTANIRVTSESPYFNGDTLAVGVPYFRCVDGFQKPIIFDALRNDMHVNEVEGDLAVNFSLPLNAGMDPPPPGQYDLYTLIFHEITHILGFVGFTVQQDGLPLDCGGARMLPELARYVTDDRGESLWVEQDGEVRFVGGAAQLPSAAEAVTIEFPGAAHPMLYLASGNLAVSGHWLPEHFDNRVGVLMLREPFPSGQTRRNLTPETKSVLENALGYTVNEEPRGLTGSWFDPESNGQGFSLHFVTREQFVVYFFGFRENRERLWMIGVYDSGVRLGTEISMELFEGSGGRFGSFDASQVTVLPWGRLDLRFHDCLSAEATLEGVDGIQYLNLQRLAGVDRLNCY